MAVDSTPKGVFSPTSSDCRGHRIIFTSYISCPLVGGHVFLEEATPIRTEMVHGPTPCQHNTQILVTVGIHDFKTYPSRSSVCTSTLLCFIWITVCMICSQVPQWHKLQIHLTQFVSAFELFVDSQLAGDKFGGKKQRGHFRLCSWPYLRAWILCFNLTQQMVWLWGLWWNCKCAQNRTSVKYSKSNNRSRSGLKVCKEVPLKAKFKIKHGFAFISFFILCVCLWISFIKCGLSNSFQTEHMSYSSHICWAYVDCFSFILQSNSTKIYLMDRRSCMRWQSYLSFMCFIELVSAQRSIVFKLE